VHYCIFCHFVTSPFSRESYIMVCASVTVPYSTARTCECGVVVPKDVKVRREEINTRYGVMPMIHWCDDKGHFYV
jgi:hypothetical protein